MAFEVIRSRASDRDLDLIFDYLLATYQDLGDPTLEAFDRATERLRSIEDDLERLGTAPFQGTLMTDIMPDLRRVTKDRAVIYFRAVESANQVQILAVFFGGQDHQNHMLSRLLGKPD